MDFRPNLSCSLRPRSQSRFAHTCSSIDWGQKEKIRICFTACCLRCWGRSFPSQCSATSCQQLAVYVCPHVETQFKRRGGRRPSSYRRPTKRNASPVVEFVRGAAMDLLANNHELKRGLDAFTKVKSSVQGEAVGWLDHVLAKLVPCYLIWKGRSAWE